MLSKPVVDVLYPIYIFLPSQYYCKYFNLCKYFIFVHVPHVALYGLN